MKLAIRILALSVVAAGTIAGYSTPRSTNFIAGRQTASALPAPGCNPFTQQCQNVR
jgi:hypothetical protein